MFLLNEWMSGWINEWKKENLVILLKVNNWVSIYICWDREKKLVFFSGVILIYELF